jgi:hypothetical protein
LKRLFLAGLFLFLLLPALIHGQETATRYLDSFTKKYAGLKDYTTDVRIHYDIEALRAPDGQARLYYKSPDKVKLEPKGIFFFPRQGGYFNAAQFNAEDFEIKILDHALWNNRKAVRLQLIPKDIKKSNQRFVLTMDIEWNLIVLLDTITTEGRKSRAAVAYERFGDFDLPTHIDLQIEVPPVEPNESKELIPFGQKTKQISGKISITYANYKVNTGLKDEIFTEPDPQPSH